MHFSIPGSLFYGKEGVGSTLSGSIVALKTGGVSLLNRGKGITTVGCRGLVMLDNQS